MDELMAALGYESGICQMSIRLMAALPD